MCSICTSQDPKLVVQTVAQFSFPARTDRVICEPKSPCQTQFTLGPCVARIWSRNTPESGRNVTRALHHAVWVSCSRVQGQCVMRMRSWQPRDVRTGKSRVGQARSGGGVRILPVRHGSCLYGPRHGRRRNQTRLFAVPLTRLKSLKSIRKLITC